MADGGGGADLEVRFAPSAAMTARDLVEIWPGAATGSLVVDGVGIDDLTPLSDCGLAAGATVSVGSPPDAPDPELHVVAGPLPPCSVPLRESVLVGRGEACGLRLDHPSVGPASVLVEPTRAGWTVAALDAGSVALDGRPVAGPTALAPGSMLSVGAVDLQLVGGDRPAPVRPPAAHVHRAVVTTRPVPDAPLEPPDPPAPSPPPTPPGVLSLFLPVAVGGVLAVAIHPVAGLVTASMPVVAVGAHLDARRRHRRDQRTSEAAQADALDRHEKALAVHRRDAAASARGSFPSAVDALTRARAGRLWPVRVDDSTVGALAVGWFDDDARAPASVTLTGDRRLGIAGPGPWVAAVARALIIQATARAGPTARRLHVPPDPAWAFTRWLPHLQGSGLPLSVDTDDAGVGLELADHRSQLTDRCAAVLEWTVDGARFWDTGPGSDGRSVRPFLASAAVAEAYARASARWIDPGPAGAAVPDRVGLRPLLAEPAGPSDDGRAALAAPLGVGPRGVVSVDLVADGPHALVAGTTGAGKSELLRTWVTALAVRHPPTALAFVLVDYKGGSAFDACARLPHVTGVVTDLDTGLGQRLLVGLQAEVRDREAHLRQAGVGDLRHLPDGPPRLVVVVDEFATLAAELPDFLGALVDVARRGRSLGVHLVLATQRPAGAVNDDIRANTALRLCLRTLDATDSQDVLGCAHAAHLPSDRPGRAWLRRGQDVELVQIAGTSAPRPSGSGARLVLRRVGERWPDEAHCPIELDTLVGDVIVRWGDLPAPSPAWLPPLPERLPLAEISGRQGGVVVGRSDRPADRSQPPLAWSPDNGHLMIVGGRGTGRTTTLRTAVLGLAQPRSAADLHVHVIARPGELADLGGLPHVGALVPSHDRLAARRLLGRLTAGGGGRELTLLVVDDYDVLAASIDDIEGLRLLEDVDRLAREGLRHRVVLAVTSSRPTLLPRSLLATADLAIALSLDDPADYGVLGLRPPPRAGVPGRGWSVDGHEVQVGLSDLTVPAVAAAHGPVAAGTGPRPAGPLPALLPLAELEEEPDGHDGQAFGRRDRDLGTARVQLRPGTPFVVSGPPRSGRSATLDLLVARADRPVTVHRSGDDPGLFLTEVRDWLSAPRPRLFAVDDAETLVDADDTLRSLVTRRHPDALVVVSVRADAWRRAYGSWLADLRPADHGVALAADPGRDAESWAVPLCGIGAAPPPGRGVLVAEGEAEIIQVARADD